MIMADKEGWENSRTSANLLTVHDLKEIHSRLIDTGHKDEIVSWLETVVVNLIH
ncbi:MAG: hypothetical protein FWH44_02170 [Methanomassiliicoccaceae archaeon]|nr:hypothetical protein [Methanomassiliicoccaceae archaeon]